VFDAVDSLELFFDRTSDKIFHVGRRCPRMNSADHKVRKNNFGKLFLGGSVVLHESEDDENECEDINSS